MERTLEKFSFDKKYYKHLWEEVFKYKQVLPITYGTHLKTRHIKLVTIMIIRLKKEALTAGLPIS